MSFSHQLWMFQPLRPQSDLQLGAPLENGLTSHQRASDLFASWRCGLDEQRLKSPAHKSECAVRNRCAKNEPRKGAQVLHDLTVTYVDHEKKRHEPKPRHSSNNSETVKCFLHDCHLNVHPRGTQADASAEGARSMVGPLVGGDDHRTQQGTI